MIGAVTPASRRRRTISGTAWAASGVLAVTRTSSDPARASSRVCLAVDSASAVSVLVMDWTATGRPPPIVTDPIRTAVEGRALPGRRPCDAGSLWVMMGAVYHGRRGILDP